MTPIKQEPRPAGWARIFAPFEEIFGLNRPAAAATILLLAGLVGGAIFWFFHSAPPSVLTITTGPPGSISETNAWKYHEILKKNNVRLKILNSGGSQENLERLENPKLRIDIGFVQSGLTNDSGANLMADGSKRIKLVSLGSISSQPLLVFYRGSEPVTLLSQLKGKRLVVGPLGSGTRSLAMTLLATNGVAPGNGTTFLDLDSELAAKALTGGTADAVFLMGDSASPKIMRELLLAPGVHLMSFEQADAYTRKFNYLNKLDLPKGSIDFGKNIPAQDVLLIGPSVEILARPNLHPALSDLLLEAAREVHGGPSLLRRKGEFPAPIETDYPISADARRFYNTGKSFLYRTLPFWLASLVNRVLVVFVPLIVVIVPGVKVIPMIFRWRVKLNIYRRYRALLALERDIRADLPRARRQELISRLEHLETSVSKIKFPASYADQFYGLRADIGFVRDRLGGEAKAG